MLRIFSVKWIVCVEVLRPSQPNGVMLRSEIVCVEVLWPSQPNGVMSRSELFVLRFYSPVNPMGSCREVNCLCWGFTAQSTHWGHVEKWIVCVEVLWPSQPSGVMLRSELFVLRFYGPVNPMGSCWEVNCLCWGFMAQSTQWGHVEKWNVCVEVLCPSQPNGVMLRSELFVLRFYGQVNPMGSCWEVNCLCWGFMAQSTQWGHVKCGQFT